MTSTSTATAAQFEVWLSAQREPESGRWVIPVDLEFGGLPDTGALQAALQDVLARHPQLRSSFVLHGGALRCRTEDTARVPLRVHHAAGPYARDAA
ncbi:MAG: hypothetical protein WCA46_23930, partial [Actinocatenispora sp.]